MIRVLDSLINKYNYRIKIVSVEILEELKEEIGKLYRKELLSEEFYREYYKYFSFDTPDNFEKIKSVVIVAIPRPQHRIYFNIGGERIPVLVPPTFIEYAKTHNKIKELLNKYLSKENHAVFPAVLPLKLLAVRSGLSRYGKNNISYIKGLGSFYQLAVYYSNIKYDGDFYELKELDNCKNCNLCFRNCPTQAISENRFLLYAEKCLTFHNERERDFPSWIDPGAHNCLVGCMECQNVCPYNKPYIDWIEDAEEFTAFETEFLLKEFTKDKFPDSVVLKFKKLGIDNYLSILPRNLKTLFKKKNIKF